MNSSNIRYVPRQMAWDWISQPEFNDAALNSPVPCRHGVNCFYKGPCSFVHPGEEGTARKIFPARIIQNEDGSQGWQSAVVRLIGSPGFYERRRTKKSWMDWCSFKGVPLILSPESIGKSISWPQVFQPLPPYSQEIKEMGKSSSPFGFHQATVALSTSPKQNETEMLFTYNQFLQVLKMKDENFTTLLKDLEKMQEVKKGQEEIPKLSDEKLEYGDKMYIHIKGILSKFEEELKTLELWPGTGSEGRITGMLLDAYTIEEVIDFSKSGFNGIQDDIMQAIEIIVETKKEAAAAATL